MSVDLDAWLDGYTAPEDTVVLIAPSPERARHSELEAELHTLATADERDPRLGGGVAARREAIAREMHELEDAARANGRELRLRVRGLTQQESLDLRAAIKADGMEDDEEEMNLRLLQQCAVDPALSRAQVERLRSTLTMGQWGTLIGRVTVLTFAERVDVPFSLAASVIRATQASSNSSE